jgi:hypothetical protein
MLIDYLLEPDWNLAKTIPHSETPQKKHPFSTILNKNNHQVDEIHPKSKTLNIDT